MSIADKDVKAHAYRSLAVAVIMQAIREAQRLEQQQTKAKKAREWLLVEAPDWLAALTNDEIDFDVWCNWVQSGCNTAHKMLSVVN